MRTIHKPVTGVASSVSNRRAQAAELPIRMSSRTRAEPLANSAASTTTCRPSLRRASIYLRGCSPQTYRLDIRPSFYRNAAVGPDARGRASSFLSAPCCLATGLDIRFLLASCTLTRHSRDASGGASDNASGCTSRSGGLRHARERLPPGPSPHDGPQTKTSGALLSSITLSLTYTRAPRLSAGARSSRNDPTWCRTLWVYALCAQFLLLCFLKRGGSPRRCFRASGVGDGSVILPVVPTIMVACLARWACFSTAP